MKKLFAILATVATSVLLAACGDSTGVGYGAMAELDIKKTTPTPTPEPEPEPEPTDTTQVVVGFKGVVVGGEFRKVTNEWWPSVKFIETDGVTEEHGGNLRPSALWDHSFNGKIFNLSDTEEVEETYFRKVENTSLKDTGLEIDTDTLRVGVEMGRPDAVFNNGITIPFDVERRYGWIVIEGKDVLLDNGLSVYQYHIDADFIGEDTVLVGEEAFLRKEIELHLKMKVTNNYFTDEDVISIFIDRKIVLPEKEEPVVEEPEPDPAPAEPEPEPDDPVVETPVVEPKIDFEIENLQSFIAWTSVMDESNKFHDCILFDCGDRWAILLDQKTVKYFSKSMFLGTQYNSLNWDDVDGCWVPALASSSNGQWVYSTMLKNGTEIKRSMDAEQACIEANKAFQKSNNAVTSWKVEAKAETTEINGKKAIVITSHRVVINKDFRIVFCES